MSIQNKKYAIAIIIIFLSIGSFLYIIQEKKSKYEFVASPVQVEKDILPSESPIAVIEEIVKDEPVSVSPTPIQKVPVYVCGEVSMPDVYYLDQTAIIKEAIMMAGGFTEDADTNAWNLAAQIHVGQKIHVPKIGEQIDKTMNSYDNSIESSDTIDIDNAGTTQNVQSKINVNKATIQQLTTLPGIGPAIAQNIIQYRENNGAFRSLQDVDNVPRIGPATLEKIKNYICFQ